MDPFCPGESPTPVCLKTLKTLCAKFVHLMHKCWVVQVISWFTFFSGIRTFSNSLEAVLTTMALYFWPSSIGDSDTTNRPLSLLFAGATVVVMSLSRAPRLERL